MKMWFDDNTKSLALTAQRVRPMLAHEEARITKDICYS